jgi:hypothetical protein
MSTASAMARLDAAINRFDETLIERLRREKAAMERQDAEQRRADAEQARADSERRREYQERYDPAFAAFGVGTPQAVADESPGRYRRRLFESLQRKLPDSNEWSDVRADDIPASARANIEALVIAAAKAEGARPSEANLPPSGEMISRTRIDDMNQRMTEWFGRESFIKSLGRPGRPVERIVDRRSNSVIWGKPLSQAR